MEKKSAKTNRDSSRLEKIRHLVDTKLELTRLEKFKNALKSKTLWWVFGGFFIMATMKQVIKPWYDQKKAQEAEDAANFLWEKTQKKSIEH